MRDCEAIGVRLSPGLLQAEDKRGGSNPADMSLDLGLLSKSERQAGARHDAKVAASPESRSRGNWPR